VCVMLEGVCYELCRKNNLFSATCAAAHTKRNCEVAIVGSLIRMDFKNNREGRSLSAWRKPKTLQQ